MLVLEERSPLSDNNDRCSLVTSTLVLFLKGIDRCFLTFLPYHPHSPCSPSSSIPLPYPPHTMVTSLPLLSGALALVALRGASAQQSGTTGNPSAATGQTFNQPTKSWEQWQPKPTYAYSALPDQYMGPDRGKPTENGYQWDQSGYNRCLQADGSWNANATCQTAWINAVDDWCICECAGALGMGERG